MIQTPVGMRCRQCAALRGLPQYQVGPLLLARSGLAGLATSVIAWLVVGAVPYLRFFLAILVGVAVGETMSRAARRRSNRGLEAIAVAVILLGAAIADLLYGTRATLLVHALAAQPAFVISLLVPAAIASFVAVIKLR